MATHWNQQPPPKMTLRQQGWAPAKKSYIPPPKGSAEEYANRPLPGLPQPPPPHSNSSSIYDSDEAQSRRQTPVPPAIGKPPHNVHDKTGVPAALTIGRPYHSSKNDEGHDTEFSGALDEKALAVVWPPRPPMTINADFWGRERNTEEIKSPQPRYPGHKVLRDEFGVSPIVSPPSTTILYIEDLFTPSPVTPDADWHVDDAFDTVSEPELDYSTYMTDIASADPHERPLSSVCEDIKPESRLSSRPQHNKMPEPQHPRVQKLAFWHSDPGSSIDTPKEFNFPQQQKNSDSRANSDEKSGKEGLHLKTTRARGSSNGNQETGNKSSPYSHWTRGLGKHHRQNHNHAYAKQQQGGGGGGGGGGKLSFASLGDASGFSGCPRNNSNSSTPVRLKLHENGRSAAEHIKTPFPPNPDLIKQQERPVSAFDFDDDEDEKKSSKKRSSFGTGSKSNSNNKTHAKKLSWDGGVSHKMGISKLVSKVTHAGGDVISKMNFRSDESKREKRAERITKID